MLEEKGNCIVTYKLFGMGRRKCVPQLKITSAMSSRFLGICLAGVLAEGETGWTCIAFLSIEIGAILRSINIWLHDFLGGISRQRCYNSSNLTSSRVTTTRQFTRACLLNAVYTPQFQISQEKCCSSSILIFEVGHKEMTRSFFLVCPKRRFWVLCVLGFTHWKRGCDPTYVDGRLFPCCIQRTNFNTTYL